ncbi:DHHW family protein [Lederbergia graminis]|uniref:DHHW family protein n=1 Tax=Lederbergia graminis TaxID=735518 RepID=A0ABW0LG35_9BACI
MSIVNKILSSIFILFISGFGVFHLIVADEDFSEQENRSLAQFPSFSWESVFSGEFMEKVEVYISDQFPFKEGWVSWKGNAEKLMLKPDMNGIYLGKNGFLFEQVANPSPQLDKNIELINYFANKTVNLGKYLLLAPTSIYVYPEKLPPFAQTYDQLKLWNYIQKKIHPSIHTVDVLPQMLKNKKESIYYKTDHHWTTRGAYYAYRELAEYMGITPLKSEDFHIQTVASNFLGTYATKTIGHDHEMDKIEIFEPKESNHYEIAYDQQKVTDSLYEWEFLNKKDKYSFYLNGNHPLVTIKSSIGNGRKLAVIKDSYAHAFIPFLTNHYEEIHMFDLRYYMEDIYQYLEDHNIHQLLILYNLPNFSKDTNLYWLKR